MNTFVTLATCAEHRVEIKGSVFHAHAVRADTPEAAMEFLRGLATRYPDASHLCWAYRIGQQYRFSDAGEPSGTAGQPILRAIEGQGLDHLIVGVVRYFGGTKLGAGGLVRAYGGVAAEALRKAQKRSESPQKQVVIHVAFAQLGVLYRILDTLGVGEREERFDEAGVSLQVKIPSSEIVRLENLLRDATRDAFRLTTV